MSEMNGKRLGNKPMYVALAQGKEARRAQLEAEHSQRGVNQDRIHPGMVNTHQGAATLRPGAGALPMYMQQQHVPVPTMDGYQPILHPMIGNANVAQGRGVQRGGYPMVQQGRGGYNMSGAYGLVQHQQVGQRGGRVVYPQGRGQVKQGGYSQGRGGKHYVQGQQHVPTQYGVPHVTHPTMNAQPNVNVPQQQVAPQQAATAVNTSANRKPLTAAALVSASPEMQKNMIGERLYPLIYD